MKFGDRRKILITDMTSTLSVCCFILQKLKILLEFYPGRKMVLHVKVTGINCKERDQVKGHLSVFTITWSSILRLQGSTFAKSCCG